jgi:hypothetical protein
MSDIILCSGNKCPQKFACYRLLIEVYGRQVFYSNPPFQINQNCVDFLDAEPIFRLKISHYELEEFAYRISQQFYLRDQCIWMLAEAKIRLEKLIKAVLVNKEIVISSPNFEEIQVFAYYLEQKIQDPLQDIHWFIAEQRLVNQIFYQRILESLKKYSFL